MATPTTLPASFTSGQVLTAAQMNNLRGAFRVLQIVNAIKTDAFTTTSTSYVDITGYTATITPSATTSKILVLTGLALSADGSGRASVTLLRGATAIADSTGFAGSNQTSAAFNNLYLSQYVSISYLDSPATTSATTYKMQLKVASGTGYINSQSGATTHGNVSTLTLMEISA
jgi:hypothetical protein